jgi:hypothetical protein
MPQVVGCTGSRETPAASEATLDEGTKHPGEEAWPAAVQAAAQAGPGFGKSALLLLPVMLPSFAAPLLLELGLTDLRSFANVLAQVAVDVAADFAQDAPHTSSACCA